jgi:hypothetical protein
LVMLTIKGKIVEGKHQLSQSDQNRSGRFLVRVGFSTSCSATFWQLFILWATFVLNGNFCNFEQLFMNLTQIHEKLLEVTKVAV